MLLTSQAIAIIFTIFKWILLTLVLAVFLVVNIRDSNYFKVLLAASLCGLIAFVFFTVAHLHISFAKSLTVSLILGFCRGFLAGAVWSSVVQLISSVVLSRKHSYIPNASEIWLFGVLPSSVYLGYIVFVQDIPYWWLKLVIVLFLAIAAVTLSKYLGQRVRRKMRVPNEPIGLLNLPILWLALVTCAVFFGVNVWLE